jgi:hypothetical protein
VPAWFGGCRRSYQSFLDGELASAMIGRQYSRRLCITGSNNYPPAGNRSGGFGAVPAWFREYRRSYQSFLDVELESTMTGRQYLRR